MDEPNPTANNSPGIEPLLTVGDLAHILKRSDRSIRYWRAKGLLPEPDVVIGSTVRWRRQTVEAWLDGGSNAGR